MVFSRRKKPTENRVDVREAYTIWDVLKSKYSVIERLLIWEAFAHDKDLIFIIKRYLKELKTNRGILENILAEFNIKGPAPNSSIGGAPVNPELVTDRHIANDILSYTQEHIENLLRGHRSAITNDYIRDLLKSMMVKTVDWNEILYKYLKLKGWLETPPIFNTVPESADEMLGVGEVGQLFDHLSFRYDSLHKTKLYRAFAHDGDFQLVLDKGIELLVSQAKLLEKEFANFQLPVPKRESDIIPSPPNTELINDEHIFRMIQIGLQGAVCLHAAAMKRCVINDRIRQIFRKMLMDEVDYFDNLIKYGKMKGWMHAAPLYITH